MKLKEVTANKNIEFNDEMKKPKYFSKTFVQT